MILRSGTRCILPAAVIALTLMASTSQATTILFAGSGNPEPTSGADGAVMTFLEDTFGASNVTYSWIKDLATGDESGFDVLVISSTPGSGDIRNKWHNSTTGVVNWEEAVVDCAGGEFCMSLGRPKDNAATAHMVDLNSAGHPIQAGLADGTITYADNPGGSVELFWSQNNGAGVGAIGHETGDTTRTFLTYADVGDELTSGNPAPGRRVMLPMTDSTFNFVTDDGKMLIANAIGWAAVPEPTGFVLVVMGLVTGLTARRRQRRA